MPLSRTDVANNALRVIAAQHVTDYDEDTESARQVRGCYEQVVRGQLERYPWFFAKKRTQAAANATAPAWKYAYAYTMPSDFLKLVELEDSWVFDLSFTLASEAIPAYEMVGRTVETDMTAPLKFTYIRDLSADPTLWSPLFADAVAAALAIELAPPLSKSDSAVERAVKKHREAIMAARRSAAIQSPPQRLADDTWLTARYA